MSESILNEASQEQTERQANADTYTSIEMKDDAQASAADKVESSGSAVPLNTFDGGDDATEEPDHEVDDDEDANNAERLHEAGEGDSSHLPKHLRLRYWTSWEELRLVELWRRYQDQVVILNKNTPICRIIMEGMKEYGFRVNAQECRRKINSFKNKYLRERQIYENDGIKSEWKLYPLIHCMLTNSNNKDYDQENKVVGDLIKEVTGVIEISNVSLSVTSLPVVKPERIRSRSVRPTPPPLVPIVPQRLSSTRLSRPPLVLAGTMERSKKWVQHLMTRQKLEELREDNRRMIERRDISLKRLRMEHQELRFFETFLKHWKLQQENLLEQLSCSVAERVQV